MSINQDYSPQAVRAAAILTNSFVAGTTIDGPRGIGVHLYNQLILNVQFTIGSLTSAEIKVEFSNDNTTFFQHTNGSILTGTTTLSLNEFTMTASGNYRIPISSKDRFIKVSAQGTGTVTASSMTIDSVMGIV